MKRLIIGKMARNDRGAVIVLVAILLLVLLGVTAFAIDFGYRHVVKNELQNAADAAALAGARELGLLYKTLSYSEQQTYVCDRGDSPGCQDVVDAAIETAYENYAGDVENLGVNASDILIGKWWEDADPTVTGEWINLSPTSRADNLSHPDAVMVRVRRDGSANGPIATFFASIFNIDNLPVTAIATAALSGQSTANPGEIELPVGISRHWFETPGYCNDVIAFSPSNDPASCAGWHTFTTSPSSDHEIRSILDNFIETGESGSPTIITNETDLNFIGGELSKNTFDSLMVSFQKNGFDISGFDGDGLGVPVDATHPAVPLCTSTTNGVDVTRCDAADSTGSPAYYPDDPTTKDTTEHVARNLHAWQTTVPVYEGDDCSNPNQSITAVGFALVEIQDVGGPSDKTIKGRVLCNYVQNEDVHGGGSTIGPFSTIGKLVE